MIKNIEEEITRAASEYVAKNDSINNLYDAFIDGAKWTFENDYLQWVKIDDSIPEDESYYESEPILLLCKGGFVYLAQYQYKEKEWLECSSREKIYDIPTHWIKIPKLPEEEV